MTALLSRRAMLGGGAALLAAPALATGAKQASVVIVGGGFGGATAARALRRALPDLRIILIEPNPRHVTCPGSNAVIGGFESLSRLEHGYDQLRSRFGVEVVHDTVSAIEAERRRVRLAGGAEIGYDRLIVSPGIDLRWNEIEGYDQGAAERMPHAWKAGPQTALLRRRLEAVEDGQVVVIAAPGNPYRCPPGPYERAGLMAWHLSRTRNGCKILILDAKDSFSKQALFQEGWKALYGDMIEWVSGANNGRVVRVNAAEGWVETDFDRFTPALANIIPPQSAGRIAVTAGLADASGFCPVDPVSFESRLIPGIHVIGDACIAGEMPKSASSANNQAKIAAAAVAASVAGQGAAAGKTINVCYSLLAPDYAISVAGVYEAAGGRRVAVPGAGGVSPLNADRHIRKAEAEYATGWYDGICADAWGA
ncbi:Sulfide dehydrogenase flavocytochrome C flavoprotein chain precursor [Paramagnetospirillum magnetotacticum MS-1]|uniref:Sulfide dehydrogenase flavocytochrome C flavoprotein chain n=1 Tax=Paramagnetospirillum magnetotacticum MS-1 TaxID=272627 RepID=A0A0C2YF33_PARME|nr:NAD(P)/FAD-dependent oxidoreductase [Paramagnetospirillum magnetotacticum]KIL98329.1 Sulfide dehydrogenase flavocytochrome C flavoprotein chain precursor [Paramagnetospirillum magnetotacticum MS-1]